MKAREQALRALIHMEEKGAYANLELKNALQLDDPREKAFATELVYGVLRYRLNLDYIRDQFSTVKPKKIALPIQQIIRLGIYQLMHLDRVPASAACNESVKLAHRYGNKGAAGFVNGLLRAVSRKKEEIVYPQDPTENLMVRYSFPRQIAETWIRDYGTETAQKIMQSLNSPKKISVRPNLLKTTPKELETLWARHGISFEKNGSVYLIQSGQPDKLPGFEEGFFTVQDFGSMKIVQLLNPKPGDRVLDACAAPGGKSCYMAQLMENRGEIIACDLYPHRVDLIKRTAVRLGARIVTPVVQDATVLNQDFFGQFDKILVDAPCSGLGVIAGKPDIKWRELNFDSLEILQYNILDTAVEYLAAGGELVYSTCTVHVQENENVVQKLLQNRQDVARISDYIQLLPGPDHDGFFMCKLKKV